MTRWGVLLAMFPRTHVLIAGLVAIGVLVVAGVGQTMNDAMAFLSPSYSPRDGLLGWTYGAGLVYVCVTFGIATHAPRREVSIVLAVQVALFATALVAFFIYHRNHPGAYVLDWDSLVKVTPFHEQLAVPVFVALVVAPIMPIVALRSERSAVGALAG